MVIAEGLMLITGVCVQRNSSNRAVFLQHNEVNALMEQSSSLDENALISSEEFVLMQTTTTILTILEARLSDFC